MQEGDSAASWKGVGLTRSADCALRMLKMLSLLLAVLLVSQCSGAAVEEVLFESFLANYSRSYRNDPEELSARFRVFQQSLERQRKLNEYEREHGGTAVYGINQFSDLTPEEFQATYLSPRRAVSRPLHREYNTREGKSSVSDAFDWRDKGVIGPIRNQNSCGSCWAFAIVETIESAYAIERNQKLQLTLSSQQLISCEHSSGLNGCKGGVLLNAFSALKTGKTVIVPESTYPFKSNDGNPRDCRTDIVTSPKKGLILTNYTYKNNAQEDDMTAMIQHSPLTTSVNAVPWQDYIGGIAQHHCTDKYVDHAVQVVGYNLTGEVPYWIVRNTWGDKWGEGGYIRIMRGANMCGIQDEVAAVYDVKPVGV